MVKDALLGLLEGSRGAFVSGEEVALRLGVSRNAVWKAAEALRREVEHNAQQTRDYFANLPQQ